MGRVMRHVAPRPLLFAALGLLALAVLVHGAVLTRGDFGHESWPAYEALMDGDLGRFWDLAPGYSAFAVAFGAPAAVLADLLGWGPDAVYRLVSLPGVIVLAFLAVTLAGSARGLGRRAQWLTLVVATGGPLTWIALHYGHPEDVLAAGASVTAVLLALRGRTTMAVVLLVLAVAAKQWAVLAVLPAAAAAPRDGFRIALAAGAGAVAIVLAQYLSHPVAASSLTSTDTLFHTRQLWYPFGIEVPGGSGERIAPDWLQPVTRPLTVALATALTLGWWARRATGRVAAHDALALLALVFLLRCALDPWNISYYHLPFLLSLVAWEVIAARRSPRLSAAIALVTLAQAISWQSHTGLSAYLLYVGWALPLATYLALRAFAPVTAAGPRAIRPLSRMGRSAHADVQPLAASRPLRPIPSPAADRESYVRHR